MKVPLLSIVGVSFALASSSLTPALFGQGSSPAETARTTHRMAFSELFDVADGRIRTKVPIMIGGATMGPGVSFGCEVSVAGFELCKAVDHDLEVGRNDDVYVLVKVCAK